MSVGLGGVGEGWGSPLPGGGCGGWPSTALLLTRSECVAQVEVDSAIDEALLLAGDQLTPGCWRLPRSETSTRTAALQPSIGPCAAQRLVPSECVAQPGVQLAECSLQRAARSLQSQPQEAKEGGGGTYDGAFFSHAVAQADLG